MKLIKTLSLSALLALIFVGHSIAEDIVVIANKNNSVSSVSVEEARRLFLLKQKVWDSGDSVFVVLPKEGSLLNSFIDKVLGMDSYEYSDHWMTLKQRKGMSEPVKMRSQASTLRMVSMKPNAVGVLSKKYFDVLGGSLTSSIKPIYMSSK